MSNPKDSPSSVPPPQHSPPIPPPPSPPVPPLPSPPVPSPPSRPLREWLRRHAGAISMNSAARSWPAASASTTAPSASSNVDVGQKRPLPSSSDEDSYDSSEGYRDGWELEDDTDRAGPSEMDSDDNYSGEEYDDSSDDE